MVNLSNCDPDIGCVDPSRAEGRGRAPITCFHLQRVLSALAVAQRPGQADHPRHRVDRELVGVLGKVVVHLTIDALVRVLCVHPQQAAVEWGVFRNCHRIGGGVEEWVEVIGVEDGDENFCAGVDVSQPAVVRVAESGAYIQQVARCTLSVQDIVAAGLCPDCQEDEVPDLLGLRLEEIVSVTAFDVVLDADPRISIVDAHLFTGHHKHTTNAVFQNGCIVQVTCELKGVCPLVWT